VIENTGHTLGISKENAKASTFRLFLDFSHLGQLKCQAMLKWGRKYLLNRNLVPLNGRTLHRPRNGDIGV
jgi:hypothetical protein